MAFYNYSKNRAERFDQIETQLKINTMNEKYKAILDCLGAEMLNSSTLDYNEYKAATGLTEMGKLFLELQKAKVDALGEIIDQLNAIDTRIDGLEEAIRTK